jgi:hypothetical protein
MQVVRHQEVAEMKDIDGPRIGELRQIGESRTKIAELSTGSIGDGPASCARR